MRAVSTAMSLVFASLFLTKATRSARAASVGQTDFQLDKIGANHMWLRSSSSSFLISVLAANAMFASSFDSDSELVGHN